jgi:hypothetical protein
LKKAEAEAKNIAAQEAAEVRKLAAEQARFAARKAALVPPEPVWPFPDEENKEVSPV